MVGFLYEPNSINYYPYNHNALVGWDDEMKIIELFCGTKSFSHIAEKLGHQTFTTDNNPVFEPDLVVDILDLNINDLPYRPDILWASPPCQCFSVATIGRNWNKDYTPKTKQAEGSILLVEKTIKLIKELQPEYWFIENPRGMLRKMPIMQRFFRRTVTYCQYGDSRMKPTDIWTNCFKWNPKPPCKNGSPCHISAPRGSRTGTQGLKNATERGKVPRDLCLEILNAVSFI